jgi:hypothetical protein
VRISLSGRLILVGAALFLLCMRGHTASSFPSLQLEGDPSQRLPHACKPSELKKLKKTIVGLAGADRPASAWSLAHAMLCRKDAAARRLVLAHMPKTMAKHASSTGDTDVNELVPRSAEYMLNGDVWQASASRELDVISVGGMVNGACGGGFNLKLVQGTWLIVSVDSACD